jgi:hypothetical protein
VIAADGDRDGIPTVLAEAMAMGIPVISTRVSGIPEVIEDGVDGFLTEPNDADTLAVRLESLLRDDSRADSLAQAGRRRVEAEFDLVRNVGYLRRLFLRSLRGWPPASLEGLEGSLGLAENETTGTGSEASRLVWSDLPSEDAMSPAPVTI